MPTPSVRFAQTGRSIGRLIFAALIGTVAPLAAQELQLKRSDPAADPFTCPTIEAPAIPTDEERRQANELASLAGEAVIVGDLARAGSLLSRATELDASSPELAYQRARLGEDMGDRATAVTELCRFLTIGSEPDAIADARARLSGMTATGQGDVPVVAIDAYRDGLRLADAGLFQDAVESFGLAIARGPIWPDAYYNSAVMWIRLGQSQQAQQDLRRYLALRPDAPDAIAVSRRLGRMEGLSAIKLPVPGAVLTLGMLAPGLGQFYSGRALGGLTTLSLTASALGVGLLAKEVDSTCMITLPAGETCPSSQVQEDTRRPYLIPGIVAAAAISLVGAVEAYVRALNRRVDTDVEVAEAPSRDGPRLVGPSVSSNGFRSDVTLIGLTFD
jgi:tetratricopeptide (TPR) repeat protein